VGGASRTLNEAGIANARAILQREVDAPGGINIGAAFSAAIFVSVVTWLGHDVLDSSCFYSNTKCRAMVR
jgi:hypothetical protein